MLSLPPVLALVVSLGAAPLTFEDALRLADARNPDLIAERLNGDVSAADIEIAGELPNPTISVSYGQDDPRLFGSIEQRLPLFGQRGTAVDAARAAAKAAGAHLVWSRTRLRAEVRRAYFGLAAANAQVAVKERLAAVAGRLAAAARKRFEVGTAAELDAEQARLPFERAKQEVVDARTAAAGARASLALLLGVRDPASLTLADGMGLQAGLPGALPPDLAQRGASAPAFDAPESLYTEAQLAAAQARAHHERIAVIPVPVVALEVQRLGNAPPVPGLRVSVGFDLPVLSTHRGAVHRADAEAAKLRAEKIALQARIEIDRATALARLEAARARAILYSRELLPRARHVQALAQLAYDVGKAPLATVLQAQTELATDESEAIASALEVQKAIADVEELGP